tara:strand:+ start:874 stop:1974 length:1101 start_codon:yes stop_codon:yes gene_type:complete
MKLVKPRFFIDVMQLAKSLGELSQVTASTNDNYQEDNPYDLFLFNYRKQTQFTVNANNVGNWKHIYSHPRFVSSVDYLFLIGQSLTSGETVYGSSNLKAQYVSSDLTSFSDVDWNIENTTTYNATLDSQNNVLNCDGTGGAMIRKTNHYNTGAGLPNTFFNQVNDALEGKSLRVVNFNVTPVTSLSNERLAGVSYGWHYTMPHQANLDYNYSINYDGVDEITSKGGNTLTNKRHSDGVGHLKYYPYQAFRKHPNGIKTREYNSGRKSWDIRFEFIDQNDLMQDYATGNPMHQWNDVDGDNTGQWAGLQNNFVSRVIYGTQGYLPFIFQPDSEKDYYTICKFDQNSFRFRQQAPDLWELSLKIVETW